MKKKFYMSLQDWKHRVFNWIKNIPADIYYHLSVRT